MDEAIEAGAEDIAMEDGKLAVETPPTEVTMVAQRLQESLQLKIHKTELLYVPKEETVVALSEEQGAQLQDVISSIEDDPSLQALHLNAVPQ